LYLFSSVLGYYSHGKENRKYYENENKGGIPHNQNNDKLLLKMRMKFVAELLTVMWK